MVIVSLLGSIRVPRTRTTFPFTITRPALISSSQSRREAIPALASTFCNRSGLTIFPYVYRCKVCAQAYRSSVQWTATARERRAAKRYWPVMGACTESLCCRRLAGLARHNPFPDHHRAPEPCTIMGHVRIVRKGGEQKMFRPGLNQGWLYGVFHRLLLRRCPDGFQPACLPANQMLAQAWSGLCDPVSVVQYTMG